MTEESTTELPEALDKDWIRMIIQISVGLDISNLAIMAPKAASNLRKILEDFVPDFYREHKDQMGSLPLINQLRIELGRMTGIFFNSMLNNRLITGMPKIIIPVRGPGAN